MLPSRRLNKTARTYFAIVTAAAAAVVAFRIPSKSFALLYDNNITIISMSSRNHCRYRHSYVRPYPYRLFVKNRLSIFQPDRRPTASMDNSAVALYSSESYLRSEREHETTLCLKLRNNIILEVLIIFVIRVDYYKARDAGTLT